jgi:hypothetical protein
VLGFRTPIMNVAEYLGQLSAAGVRPADLPAIQPLFQHRIWQQMAPGDGPDRLASVVEQLRIKDDRFHMDGGSWTSDVSWVRGDDQVLVPMEQASSLFHERVLARGVPTDDRQYRKALFHLLPPRPAASATGGKGLGPTTAPSCPAVSPSSSPVTPDRRRSLPGCHAR